MVRNLASGCFVCFVVISTVIHSPVRAGRRMTPELIWKLGRLGSACVDTRGTVVAYAVRRFDLPANKGTSEIHVIDLQSGRDRVLVRNLKSADSLQLASTPHGSRLFYVGAPTGNRDTDAHSQVWSIGLDGKNHLQVTRAEKGVANLKVSPDGAMLAFTSRVKLDQTVNELYADLPQAKARLIDSLMYRHWNTWHDFSYSHLHVATLADDGRANEAVDVMKGLRANCPLPPFGGAEQFCWSPDSHEIAYTAKLVNNPAESTDSDVYLVAVDGESSARCITPGMNGFDTDPTYSPDGAYIAFHSMARAGFEADKNRIMLYDRASGTIRDLTARLDQTTHQVTWMPDGRSLLFMSEYRGTNQLFRLALDDQRATRISRGQYNWSLLGTLPGGRNVLVSSQSMIRPQELSLLTAQDGSSRRLTHINDKLVGSLELPTIRQRWVRASDGRQIHCWVIYPPDFDPARKWPLLTYCQGGPQGQIGQRFSFRWNFHLMAAKGYIIIAPNRRGLPGFGRAWNDQISGDWGGQAMQDILAATDAMMTEPFVDTQHMGAIGASFGGYTVYWLMGHHQDRFCCMVAHAGVFNLESMYGSTEEIWFPEWDLGGPYWKDPSVREKYDRFSPHRFVGNWRTPLLVIHGEKDFRVPVTQGMEAFTAAQLQGVPSRFLYFPEECHWVLGPQNGVLWHRVFFQWLDQFCKPK